MVSLLVAYTTDDGHTGSIAEQIASTFRENDCAVEVCDLARLSPECAIRGCDDMAMAGGREVFGYPKKMAESITLSEEGSTVIGSVVRKGTEILRIELDPNTTEGVEKLAMAGVPDPEDPRSFTVTANMFKHFMSPTMRGFDYVPRLVAEPVVLRPRPDVRCGAGQARMGGWRHVVASCRE